MRDSDPEDPYRQKTVQLLDDFRLPGVNGNRILSDGCRTLVGSKNRIMQIFFSSKMIAESNKQANSVLLKAYQYEIVKIVV